MELGKQIKKYRTAANMSQEELADQLFVSRQTISNWECNKSYPDIKSLVLIGNVFHVSVDQIIKGDVERMKREIDIQEYAKFQKDSIAFSILFVALLILPVPLVMAWKWLGMALYVCLFGIGMYVAGKLERYKKKYDIQTYREIMAFSNGMSLNEIEQAREEAKRPYQKVLLAAGSALLVVVVALIMTALMKMVL